LHGEYQDVVIPFNATKIWQNFLGRIFFNGKFQQLSVKLTNSFALNFSMKKLKIKVWTFFYLMHRLMYILLKINMRFGGFSRNKKFSNFIFKWKIHSRIYDIVANSRDFAIVSDRLLFKASSSLTFHRSSPISWPLLSV